MLVAELVMVLYVLKVSSKTVLISNLVCVESRVEYLLKKRKRREERNGLRFIRTKTQQDSTMVVSLQQDIINGEKEILWSDQHMSTRTMSRTSTLEAESLL